MSTFFKSYKGTTTLSYNQTGSNPGSVFTCPANTFCMVSIHPNTLPTAVVNASSPNGSVNCRRYLNGYDSSSFGVMTAPGPIYLTAGQSLTINRGTDDVLANLAANCTIHIHQFAIQTAA